MGGHAGKDPSIKKGLAPTISPALGLQCLRHMGLPEGTPRRAAMQRHRPQSLGARGALEQAGAGHIIWQSGAVYWCARCAFHSVSRLEGFRRPCEGVTTPGSALRRKLLLQGRHPQTGEAILERPIKIGATRGQEQPGSLPPEPGENQAARERGSSWEGKLAANLNRFGLSVADLDISQGDTGMNEADDE